MIPRTIAEESGFRRTGRTDEVERLCGRTLARLSRDGKPDYTDDIVTVYLEDAALRREDRDYARIQRMRLSNWLEGSEIISR